MGLFKFSTEQEESTTDERLKAIDSPQQVSDTGMVMGQGFEDIGQLIGGAAEYGAKKLSMPETAARVRSAINRSKDNAATRRDYMSERGRAAADAPLIGPKEYTPPGAPQKKTQTLMDDPLETIALKSARMVPLVLATAIPGSILSGLGAGTLAVAGATGVTGGALGAGDMVNTVNDEIDAMPHEQLMKESPVYQHMVENGADPQEARDTIKEITMDQQVPLATLINFATNLGGPEAGLAKALGGHAAGKGFVKGALEGVLTGGVTEGIEGATTAYGQQKTAEEFGGKKFDWLAIAKQGIEEGAFGSLFGGVIGGATNIKGRSKAGGPKAQPATQIEPTQAATPDAAQAAALSAATTQPSPPVPPPTAKKPAVATPAGPATVQTPGTETPPPGASIEKTKRVYKKPEAIAGATPVQTAPVVGPDPTQVAVAPPLVRKRAQAELAAPATVSPPVPAVVEPPAPAPPVQETPVEQAPPAQVAPPAAVEPPAPPAPLVLGGAKPGGRVLPDLQAEARKKAEFEAKAAKPDEVAGRGRRYEQTEASITNPVEHAMWRRKMALEAKGPNPSPIAVQASKIKSTRGVNLKPEEKQYLQDLHKEYVEEQNAKPVAETPEEAPRGKRGQIALPGGLKVKNAKQFVLEAARAAQEANANPTVQERLQEFQDILRAAPNREEIMKELREHPFVQQAATIKEKLDKGTATEDDIESFERAENDFVGLSQAELDAQTRDIEAGVSKKGGTGSVEISAELPTSEEASTAKQEEEVVTKVGKAPVVESGTFGKASEVRKVPLTEEAKAAALATLVKVEGKQKSEAAPGPARQVRGDAEPARTEAKPAELPKKVTKPTKSNELKAKQAEKELKSRREIADRIGGGLMDMHRAANDELNTNGDTEIYKGLKRDITNLEKRLKDTFGEEEHDRIQKVLGAALNVPAQRGPPVRPLTTNDVVRRILEKRQMAREGTIGGMDMYGIPNGEIGKLVSSTKVGYAINSINFDSMVKSFLNMPDEAWLHKISHAINKNMVPRILTRVGNVPIHIVDEADWARLYPASAFAGGFYQPSKHAIYIPSSVWNGNVDSRAHLILHEAVHAAFVTSVEQMDRALPLLQRIIDEVVTAYGKPALDQMHVAYGFTHPHEIIAEVFSNPRMQALLAQTAISDNLAAELGVKRFKKYSLWTAVVDYVRRAIGLPPNTSSALEAVLTITDISAGARPAVVRVEDVAQDPFVVDYNEMLRNDAARTTPQLAMQPMLLSAMKQNMEDRVPTAGGRSWLLNLVTLHQMSQMADRYFPKGLAIKVSDVVEKMRVYRAKLIDDASKNVITPLHTLQTKYKGTDEWEKFTDLADRATSANIHPDVPLAHKRNSHVKKSFKWRYARQEHALLSKQFAALPDDMKAAWHKARIFFTDMQNDISFKSLENIVEASLGRRDEQLTRRIHNGTMTEADRGLFMTNKAMSAIANARELKKIKGVYFPKMRRGNYVITGEYKLPQWEQYLARDKKTNEEDGRYVFTDKNTADNFLDDVRKRGLVVTNSRTYSIETSTGARKYTLDPATGRPYKIGPSGLPVEYPFSKGDTGTHEVFEHVVQKQLVDFFESEKAAREAERNYKADPNYRVDGYETKDKLAVRTSKVTSRQIKSALKSMEQSSKWKAMSDGEKKALEQAFMEMSLSFVSSTAPQNRARPRRNVLGASKDLTRNTAEYAAAASGSLSNLTHMPELETAFNALDKHRDDFRHQTGDITSPRKQILDKMRDMAYADDFASPNKRNRVINGLLVASFMDKLASPAYHMINSLQPWMVSVPVLGGRHGFARTTYELARAYKDMGYIDTMKSGAKDTKKAIFDHLEGTTDYMADMRKKLTKQKDGAELADMLDYLHEHGGIDKDSGLEVAELINAASKAEHILHRLDHVVRQFGTAVEVVNRATTAIAAYRMERARGASVEDARLYAQESVNNTQGNYSTSNAPKLFKHPLGRIVLQFKKFAQLQYFLLSKLAYNAFKGSSPQERAEAAKGLAALLVAHAAMAGATGLPTEPIKIPWMILSMFLPMPTWEEIEQGATEYAQRFLGDNLGDAVTHGLPRLAGVDLNSRVGLNSLLFFGEPKGDKVEDVKSWVFDTVMGAPMGLGVERVQGVRALLGGDFGDAAEKLVPFKFLADSVKGYRTATEGKSNKRGEQVAGPSLISGLIQGLGFKPAAEARRQEATAAFYKQTGRRKAERQDLLDEFTTTRDRASVRRKILRYNTTVPKEAKITMQSLEQLLKRKTSDKKKGYVRKGAYGGKLNKDLLDKYIGE